MRIERACFTVRQIAGCLLALGLMICLAACDAGSQRDRLEQRLRQLQTAMQAQQAQAVLALLAEDFKARQLPAGGQLEPWLTGRLQEYPLLRLQLSTPHIRMHATQAEVSLQAQFSARRFGQDPAHRYAVRMRWVFREQAQGGGDWYLQRLDWQRHPAD